MDRTTRLIDRQRITIAALLLGLLSAMTYARSETARANSAAVFAKKETMRADHVTCDYCRVSTELWKIQFERKNDAQIIHDLVNRLRRYEARHGEITPSQNGDGVYIAKRGLKAEVDR